MTAKATAGRRCDMGAGFRVAVVRPGMDPYLTDIVGERGGDGRYNFDGAVAQIVGGPARVIDRIHGDGAVVLVNEDAVGRKKPRQSTLVCMGRDPKTGGPLDMTIDVWLTVCDEFAANRGR